MTATVMPADLEQFRRDFAAVTGLPLSDIGALPDADHKSGGGYHCGCQDIKDISKWGSAGSSTADYSVRQSRDRITGNVCSAKDHGLEWRNGGRAAAIRYNNLLVAQMRAGDPELAALRAVNFTPDGVVKRRYDSNSPGAGIISSTDTVLWHTHEEFWRNTANTTIRARTFARMLQIARAAVMNVPLSNVTGGSTMDSEWHTGGASGPFITQGNPGYAGQQRDTALAFTYQAATEARGDVAEIKVMLQALTTAHPEISDEDMAQIRDEARAGALDAIRAGTADLVAAIVAALPSTGSGPGGGITADDVEAALREVFADAAS